MVMGHDITAKSIENEIFANEAFASSETWSCLNLLPIKRDLLGWLILSIATQTCWIIRAIYKVMLLEDWCWNNSNVSVWQDRLTYLLNKYVAETRHAGYLEGSWRPQEKPLPQVNCYWRSWEDTLLFWFHFQYGNSALILKSY